LEDIARDLGNSNGQAVSVKVSTGSGRCSERTKRRRSAETYRAASNIHASGKRDEKKSCAMGLIDAVEMRCEEDDLVKVVGKGKKLKERVFPKIQKKAVKLYESSTENMLRSVAVYYSNGVMGKSKYRSVYRASTYSYSLNKKAVRMSVANCPIPRLVPYHIGWFHIQKVLM
jgi:hypothetical protein